MIRASTRWGLVLLCLLLQGCGQEDRFADLKAYVEEVRAKPKGTIEPLPKFKPYESFAYSAAGMRSPFDRPIEIQAVQRRMEGEKVAPDTNRAKEFLEGFNIDALVMVGTIAKADQIWALLSDGSGGIHRVTQGNHLGRNHGRVVAVHENKIDVVEIVPDGQGGWVERPRTLDMKE
ncbi:MAG TPA: pilus assembly protein PilP [Pseudomonadales bacterium]|jgi:type IV pilus assembly protein PilP|nr:pilus assembly protein PilP [Pseudomonadales bacterium]